MPLSDTNQPHLGEPGDRQEQAAIGTNDRGLRAFPAGAFPPELLPIWEDPEVRRFAARRAGDPDLTQDALLQAVCAVARVKDLERISDLKAYFCRVLVNEMYHLRGQLGAARACDPVTLAEMSDAEKPGSPSDEAMVVTRLMARTWLVRFSAQRDDLRASVPGRSGQADRYRDLIVAVAERVLHAALDGGVSRADANEALQAAFPEWFGQSGSAENACHEHLSRARRDVQDLLKAVVSRDELLP